MAEMILKAKTKRLPGLSGWQISSAGIHGLIGEPAHLQAVKVLRERGIDLSSHIARLVSEELISQSDLILTMEKCHKEVLLAAYPSEKDKIFFIGDVSHRVQDIFDPIAGTLEDFQAAAKEITQAIDGGFLLIVVQALQNSLGYLEPLFSFHDDAEREFIGSLSAILDVIDHRPVEIKYALFRFLLHLYPKEPSILYKINEIVHEVPPTQEEEAWLRKIQLLEIILPLTCLKFIKGNVFRHPEIQEKLKPIQVRLENPDLQNLYQDLEQLYAKNLPNFKYRLGIWDLSVKYKNLPFRVGDYEEAYHAIRM
jgi:protein-tyrosine-phosphatase